MQSLVTLIAFSILALAIGACTYPVAAVIGWKMAKPLERRMLGKHISYQSIFVLLFGLSGIMSLSVAVRTAQTQDVAGLPIDIVPLIMVAIAIELIVGIPLNIWANQIKSRRNVQHS